MENIDYIFPKKNWYIEITDDNREIINNWKIKQKYNDDLFKNLNYKYVYFDGRGGRVAVRRGIYLVLITTSEFIQYVLKQSVEPTKIINDNLDYLQEFLTKLNIK